MNHDLQPLEGLLDELGARERGAMRPEFHARLVAASVEATLPRPLEPVIRARAAWLTPMRLAASLALAATLVAGVLGARTGWMRSIGRSTMARAAASVEADHLGVLCDWLSSDVDVATLEWSEGDEGSLDDLLNLEGVNS